MRTAMWKVLTLGGLAGLTAGGCNVTVIPGDGNPPPPTPTRITIRIENATNKPLDPQICVGGDPAAGPEGLFVPEKKRTGFGLGGLGVMERGSSASFTVPCGQLMLFGTFGGIFGDDLNNPDDAGRQVVLQEGAAVTCGDTVTFRFTGSGNTLVTSYTVTPFAQ